MATKIMTYHDIDEQIKGLGNINTRQLLYGIAHRLPGNYAKRCGIKEADILRETKQILTKLRIWHRRIDTAGKIIHGATGTTMVPGAMKGLPDILGCLADGRLLGIECKAPGGSVSADQHAVLSDLACLGACVCILVDVNKLEYFLETGEATAMMGRIAVV